jgi:peptidoglycan/xylan/chitin deacetylase (PgdA/CDA1 family)
MPRHATSTEMTTLQNTVNFLSASGLTQKTKRAPDNITWITRFEAGHGWTSADVEVNVNSAEVSLSGTQGVKYGPADPGTFKTLSSPNPITPGINVTNSVIVIPVRALDNNGAGLEVWLADAAFTNYRIYYPDPLNYQVEDGWTFLTIHVDANTGGTGTLDLTNVQRIRVRFSDPVASHAEYIGGIGYAPVPATYPNGVVTIDFDDNATGQFELARPLLIAKNYPASVFAIGDVADSKTDGHMSVADMHMLEDMYGWEIGAHSATSADHVSMQTLTDAQIADSVLRVRQWLTSRGFKANTFAYPNGGSDTRVRNEVRKYFSLGRRVGYTPLMMNVPMTSGQYSYGASFATTAASITPLIDKAVANKQWLALGFHSIVSGASAGGNMGSTDFSTVLDYIQSKGMAVVTPSTLFGLKK